jgi:hypothetical protein
VGRVKFFDCHFEGTSEKLRGLVKVASLFTENTLSKMNDPIDRMIITQASKYLYSFCKVLCCWIELIEKHQVFGKIAVTHSVVNVVLTHLLFSQGNRLVEIL